MTSHHPRPPPHSPPLPFETNLFESKKRDGESKKKDDTLDGLPALHHFTTELGTSVESPCDNTARFLQSELSFGDASGKLDELGDLEPKRPPLQLHVHASMGLEIVAVDRIALHLLDDKPAIFLKPIPRFLLNPDFWSTELQCPPSCACDDTARLVQVPTNSSSCLRSQREIALGFLYTYACLISSELDFAIANDKRLLPRNPDDSSIGWEGWKRLARELQRTYDPNKVHPRFLLAELSYTDLFRGDRSADLYIVRRRYRRALAKGMLVLLTSIIAVCVALTLTAMQVGLATKELQESEAFVKASSSFALAVIFSLVILPPLLLACIFVCVYRKVGNPKR